MKQLRSFSFFLLFFATASLSAQLLPKASITILKRDEDSMKVYSRQMIWDRTASVRFAADSVFIRHLVKSLRTPYSFYYPFDSLKTISRIYAPDSSFRIFSWQWSRDDDYFRQRGAIQMKTADGSLQLYPLLDMSDFTSAPQDSVRNGRNWIGAIYYGIVLKTFNGKKYYTLLGYDDNNRRSAKKWIEVLSFDQKGKPIFGGPYFSTIDGNANATAPIARFGMEYKKEGSARLNYDKEMDMIIYDHLISETNEPTKQYTMVPDGDYQGFKWANGKWVLVDKVFNYKLRDGQAPVPEPIKDVSGKSDELKLLLQSEKNRQNSIPPKAPSKAPVRRNIERNPSRESEDSL